MADLLEKSKRLGMIEFRFANLALAVYYNSEVENSLLSLNQSTSKDHEP